MFGGVKITLILCATMVVCCVLFISYNEYTNRYTLLTSNDNSLYIFDKKSTVLNKCDSKSCSAIETKLPMQNRMNFDTPFQQSRMFDTNRPMASEVAEKMTDAKAQNSSTLSETQAIEAKPVEGTAPALGQSETKTDEKIIAKDEPKNDGTNAAEDKNVSGATKTDEPTDTSKPKDNKKSADDEFVE